MKAIELNSKTDKSGYLRIDYKLDKSESNVRVLILLEDNLEQDEEKFWADSISGNPVFDFLNDTSEDIYSINDGEPIND